MAGGGGSQTVNQEPPKYLAPYLSDVARLAQQSFYGGAPVQPGGAPAQGGQVVAPTSSNAPPPNKRNIFYERRAANAAQPSTQPSANPAMPGGGFNWPQYFPDSTVVPFSPQTESALGMQEQRAMSGSPVTQAAQSALLGNLGGANPAMSGLQQMAGGAQNPALPGIQGLMGSTNPAISYATQLAQGGDISGAFNAAMNKLTPQINSAFERAGRSGSGLAQTAQTQAAADTFAGLYGDEQNRKLAAAGLLGNLSGQDFNQNLSALGLQGNLANQDTSNQLSSLGLLGSNYLGGVGASNQAAALAPGLAASDYTDIGQLAQVGAQRESLSQQQLQDKISRFNYGQQLPYNMLQNYAGLISGTPAIGGTTTMPGASTGQNLLGGGLAGAGLAQMFGVGSGLEGGALASSLGPWAMGGAALMGLLG